MSEIKALDKLRRHYNGAGYADFRRCCDEVEAEIANNYMLRPVDADGVQVRVGDTVSPYLEDGSYTVERITLYNWGWRVTADGVDADGGKCTISVSANNLHHVKPRTLEDVLNDRVNDVLHVMTSGTCIALETALNDSFGEECADEIRELLLGGDGS